MDELQRLVDTLAEKLGRSVAIDDPRLHLQAYSPHHGKVDEVRMTSILTRQVPIEVARWVFTHGIREAVDVIRLPRKVEFGIEPRVCVPVRHAGALLGFLWLIDPDGTVTEEDLELCRRAAETAADLMFRNRLLDDLRLGRERELLRDLLNESVELRRQAAAQMFEHDLVAQDRAYRAIVLVPATEENSAPDTDALESAAIELRARHSRRQLLTLGRPHHQVFIVAESAMDSQKTKGGGLGLQIHEIGQRALARDTLVGVGDARRDLADILGSYNEAQLAARVAKVVTSLRPVAEWRRLGIYQMLVRFPVEEIGRNALPAGLSALLQRSEGPVLANTLEAYLDLAGSAAKAAKSLGLHRVSFYGRLRRIEDLTGIDLGDGQQRLALHLGLKLARLAGLR